MANTVARASIRKGDALLKSHTCLIVTGARRGEEPTLPCTAEKRCCNRRRTGHARNDTRSGRIVVPNGYALRALARHEGGGVDLGIAPDTVATRRVCRAIEWR